MTQRFGQEEPLVNQYRRSARKNLPPGQLWQECDTALLVVFARTPPISAVADMTLAVLQIPLSPNGTMQLNALPTVSADTKTNQTRASGHGFHFRGAQIAEDHVEMVTARLPRQ